jgi:hypothetical protein
MAEVTTCQQRYAKLIFAKHEQLTVYNLVSDKTLQENTN